MKVAELVAELEKFDEDKEVIAQHSDNTKVRKVVKGKDGDPYLIVYKP